MDSRQLSFLKLGCVKKDKESAGKMKLFEFKNVMNTILKNQKSDRETFEAIISFIKDDKNEDEILLEKLNTLIEVFQFYPLIVKKDKNQSTSIYYIMNANKTPDHSVSLVELNIL